MHKDTKVASCYFDKRGYLTQVIKVYNEEHLPVIAQKNTLMNLQKWISMRLTSKERTDLAEFLTIYDEELLNTLHATSLFDCYWFCDEDTATWDDVNPYKHFDNNLDLVEQLLLSPSVSMELLPSSSPNLTIPGSKTQYWYKDGESLYLLFLNAKQEMNAYNKVKNKDFPVSEMEYFIYKSQLFAKKKMLVSDTMEYIPFEEYYVLFEKNQKHSRYQKLLDCCEHFNIPESKDFFIKMMEYDTLTNNDDRELNDIGVLRNPDTLEIVGFHTL